MAEIELLIPQINDHCHNYIYIYLIRSPFVVPKVLQVELLGLEPTVHGWVVNFQRFLVFFYSQIDTNWIKSSNRTMIFQIGWGKSHQLLDGSVSTSCFNDHHFEADGGSHTRGKKSRQRQCLERNDLGMIHFKMTLWFSNRDTIEVISGDA